uniref:Thiol:disulfide interchange protein n=1 Tax=Leptosiphonia brodiei TaxID=2608611 RepID=A0A1Z1MA23_9FLOR|nr:thiol:disulfide interchange protein [Leptosiphonia brodiei]ARW62826.1 thiol:disulfide interchange protein [Leptosiphonia brodiei]
MSIIFSIFVDKYETILYYFQYYFSKFVLSSSISNIIILLIVFVFLGILTIFTPCFVSILPLSFSYISYGNNTVNNIIFFICGILTSFLLFILSSNTISSHTFFAKLPILSSSFMVLLSLDLMNILDLSKAYFIFNSFFKIFEKKNIKFETYFTGLMIGLSSLPCNTSILVLFNFLVKNINNTFHLFLYYFAYLTGIVIPLFLIFSLKLYSLSANIFSSFWFFFNRFAGSLLLVVSLSSLLKLITY